MPVARGASRRRKRLGQHFLVDPRVADRCLDHAGLSASDVVLEIGPGLGFLTRRLAPRVKQVIAVELDSRMLAELERRGIGNDNVRLVHGDATKIDYADLGPFNKIVANLPYSASSPITFRLLPLPFELAVLMYQEEFADRLVAGPGDPDYGRLSAARAYYAEAEILETVPPGAFQPPPEVRSAVVRLRRHAQPPFEVGSPRSYGDLLRVLFSTRRKTLRSTLRRHHAELGLATWEPVEGILRTHDWAERRPEELAPPELGALDRELGRLRNA